MQLKIGDGRFGWSEAAPFDAIIVTAAPLVKQLKVGGRMIIPVDTALLTQHLLLVEKQPDGSVIRRADGSSQRVAVNLRLNTPIEFEYCQAGGILPYVLKQLLD